MKRTTILVILLVFPLMLGMGRGTSRQQDAPDRPEMQERERYEAPEDTIRMEDRQQDPRAQQQQREEMEKRQKEDRERYGTVERNGAFITIMREAGENPLTINFQEMNQAVGQRMEVRILDQEDEREIARASYPELQRESFSLELRALEEGRDYYVDIWSDRNDNQRYDDPPTDLSWRLEIEDAEAQEQIQFSPTTDYTALDWTSLITINLNGLQELMGQQLEIRLRDRETGEEVVSTTIEELQTPELSVTLPGIEPGRNYEVEVVPENDNNNNWLNQQNLRQLRRR